MYIVPKILRKVVGFPALKKTIKDKTAKVDVFSVVVRSNIGKYSYIGEHSSVIDTDIGAFTSISNYCAIGGGDHPKDWVSTSPVFNSSKSILNIRFGNLSYNPFRHTKIGNDVWIGSHVLIKAGINIGDGAIIGMGAIVTKDVGPYEIWVGNPARCIGKRFDENTIEYLLKIKWWLWNDEKLSLSAPLFSNVKKIMEEL